MQESNKYRIEIRTKNLFVTETQRALQWLSHNAECVDMSHLFGVHIYDMHGQVLLMFMIEFPHNNPLPYTCWGLDLE